MESKAPNTEAIWEKHGKTLLLFIQSRVKDKTIAQDLLQDVFIKIHLNLSHLKQEKSLLPWIYQIARNVITNHYRSPRLHVVSQKAEIPDTETASLPADFMNCMSAFLHKLPKKYKQALVLTDLGNQDQKQLSKQLNLSYSGAKSRVQRARRLLRSYFEDCCQIVSDKYGNIVSHKAKGNCLCAA